jgi:DNA-binding HxlR family transcriptional regulator
VKVVYSLTEHGKRLNDGVHALALWGLAHRERVAALQVPAA